MAEWMAQRRLTAHHRGGVARPRDWIDWNMTSRLRRLVQRVDDTLRSFILSDAVTGRFDRVSDFWGYGPTASGVPVTEELGEKQGTVYTCKNLLSNAVGSLPFKVYDGTTEAADHPLYDVLKDQPNAEQSAFEFRVVMTAWLLTWGSAFAEVVRNTKGQVVALWPLAPWLMRLDRDDRRRLRFTYGPTQKVWIHDPSRPPILRLVVNSQDGITGRSPIRMLAESLGIAIAQEKFGAQFFGNGASFGGVLTSELQDLDEDQRKELRGEIEKFHKNRDNPHRLLVLGAGFKYASMSTPPNESQFLESRQFSRATLSAAFGVPPLFAGELTAQSQYRTPEEARLSLFSLGVDPLLVNWESAVKRDLIGPREGVRLDARFTRSAFVRTDHKTLIDSLAVQIDKKLLTLDEARALLERPPLTRAPTSEPATSG